MTTEMIERDCRIIRESDDAILLEAEGEDVWIPLSQVSKIVRSCYPDPDCPDRVTMTRWIADKKGLL